VPQLIRADLKKVWNVRGTRLGTFYLADEYAVVVGNVSQTTNADAWLLLSPLTRNDFSLCRQNHLKYTDDHACRQATFIGIDVIAQAKAVILLLDHVIRVQTSVLGNLR
jgi:hypothetical protein